MREFKGLGACLLISLIKPILRHLQYAYSKQKPRDTLFTISGDLWMCGRQMDWNIMNIARILVFLDDLVEVLPGICGEFDVVCLLLEGLARLLGMALL